MKFNCSHTALVEIHKLQPNPKNNNSHPDRQIELLAKIIDYQGQRSPIVVSKRSGFITKGHGRLEAIKKLGWTKAAVDYQDYETEAQEYADLVADNKIAELAKFDDAKMIEELKVNDALKGLDFELLGLPDFELPDEPDPAKEEIEDDVPTDVETRCKPGDLWILGEHRLLCGDSTNIQHVERLMGGEKADMVFTDPPYGINLDTDFSKMSKGCYTYKKVANDDKEFDPSLIIGFFDYCEEIFLWGAENFIGDLAKGGSWIVWDKSTEKSDDCFFANPIEFCWSKARHKYMIYRQYWRMMAASEKGEKRMHPTQKPVDMNSEIISKFSSKNQKIVDLFGGSGSTLIACEKTNRKCFMMEIDPHYCDVILSRWEKYSGKKASLINS